MQRKLILFNFMQIFAHFAGILRAGIYWKMKRNLIEVRKNRFQWRCRKLKPPLSAKDREPEGQLGSEVTDIFRLQMRFRSHAAPQQT